MPYDIKRIYKVVNQCVVIQPLTEFDFGSPFKKKKEGKKEMLIITSPPEFCYVAKLKAKTENPQR